MKHIFLTSMILLLFPRHVLAQDEVLGKWKTQDQEAIIEIYKAPNGKYQVKITWLKKPNDENDKPFTDSENPDKNLKNKPLLGLIILKSLEYASKEWKGRTIYDPTDGKTYKAKLWLSDTNTLELRGYWGFFIKLKNGHVSNENTKVFLLFGRYWIYPVLDNYILRGSAFGTPLFGLQKPHDGR